MDTLEQTGMAEQSCTIPQVSSQILVAFFSVILFAAGCNSDENSKPPTIDSSTPHNTEPVQDTRPSTITVILGTYSWDVERNDFGGNQADFHWNQVSASERYLVPKNGAGVTLVSDRPFSDIDRDFLNNLTYTAENLTGANDNPDLKAGTVVAFRTAEGNVGKFEVVRYRGTHDFEFPESEKLTESWKDLVLRRPNKEKYHLEVKWQLFVQP